MADRALLVGINKYPGAPLSGCVNDVLDMARFITTSVVKFDPANVRLLTDARATTKEILARLEWLVTGLRPGNRILFHYSGHGAQVATRAGSGELDGLDEVICPVDFDWSDPHMIRDKQFHTLFDKIPAGVKAVWISDSCHSGDLGKDAAGLGGRSCKAFPMPEDIGWRLEAAKMANIAHKPSPYPNIALVSGCKPDQTSADARFGDRPNGALTYFLLQVLKAHDGLTLPLTAVGQRVRAVLTQNNYEQQPQVEGPEAYISVPFLK